VGGTVFAPGVGPKLRWPGNGVGPKLRWPGNEVQSRDR